MNICFLLLCFTTLLCHPYRTVSSGSRNATAQQVIGLLSFKSMVSSPYGSLLSWNSSNHVCRWQGVGCSRKHPERIVELNLNSLGLSGRISPFLGNLTYLKRLNLGENQLVGQTPRELGCLGRLQVLNLSSNSLEGNIPETLGRCVELVNLNLSNNLFHGNIPGEIGNLKNLMYLHLHTNLLSGAIPMSLGNLSSLTLFSLGNNSLSGEVPVSTGNISSLEAIFLWENHLSGGIPSSLGRLSNLLELDLEDNNLSGSVPPAIWNISSLIVFAVSGNQLTGTIPPYTFSVLPRIQIFFAAENLFHGRLPSSLANASHLSEFEIPFNNLSGVIPSQLERLQNLRWLTLSFNDFEAKEPQDWNFIEALTNCSQLETLQLDSCWFSGVLPSALSNLSTSLKLLTLNNNQISGHIPREIGNLVNLDALSLAHNSLTGVIPSSVSMLGNLKYLSFENNKFSGPIPPNIGNLTQLNDLSLAMNAFSESIPATLGYMTSLLKLDLSHNNFSGMIPPTIFNITTLSIYFRISNNNLEGPIPPEVGNLQNLVEFDAKLNHLSGKIPPTLGNCKVLQILYLQNNSFNGHISSLFNMLKGLETLDLSSNNFSGQIPKFLGTLSALSSLNLSFNSFEGEVPIVGVFTNASRVSVVGNRELCGGITNLHLPPCSLQTSKSRHKSPTMVVVVSVVATAIVTCIISLLLVFLVRGKKRSRGSDSTMSVRGHKFVSYPQLVRATDGFSTTNLLGTGSSGSVYKGRLCDENGANEQIVAIKVLKLQTPGALKSFTAECEAMRNLRHRNLVKIVTACSSIDCNGNDFKAIVFDFMANGSLDDWLHPRANDRSEERYSSLNLRVGVLYDVACALDYLHLHGAAPIVHCDIKPSNVLLDADMVAHVGDFGIAKILGHGCSLFEPSTSSLGFRGTIGYAPPEYGAGNMVTTYGDIYSYGILVLEMMTGRKPTDNTTHGVLGLRNQVEMALNNGVMDIIDTQLVPEVKDGHGMPSKRKIDSMVSLLKMGMLCSVEMPSSRMATKVIIKELHVIRRTLAHREER